MARRRSCWDLGTRLRIALFHRDRPDVVQVEVNLGGTDTDYINRGAIRQAERVVPLSRPINSRGVRCNGHSSFFYGPDAVGSATLQAWRGFVPLVTPPLQVCIKAPGALLVVGSASVSLVLVERRSRSVVRCGKGDRDLRRCVQVCTRTSFAPVTERVILTRFRRAWRGQVWYNRRDGRAGLGADADRGRGQGDLWQGAGDREAAGDPAVPRSRAARRCPRRGQDGAGARVIHLPGRAVPAYPVHPRPAAGDVLGGSVYHAPHRPVRVPAGPDHDQHPAGG